MIHKTLILASTSKYRQNQLKQLGLPFVATAPNFDEEAHKDRNLSPQALAENLAYFKAQSLKAAGQVVIGGDQLVAHRGVILGKPHTREGAIAQLQSLQGSTHELITAICVFDGESHVAHTEITRLKMKPLTLAQIERYVDLDQPFDCSGSYKIEVHGMMLFETIDAADFSAIQGLPLLALSKILKASGFQIP